MPDTGVFSKGTVPANRQSPIRNRQSRRGQVLLYLVGVLGVLGLTALWLLDSNTAIVSRIRAQNGADAAALAAAQWQGRSLNALGEINLVKAIATLLVDVPPGQGLQARLAAAPPEQAFATIQQALTELQAEIRFVGPILAFVAAQQGAKNNAVPVNDSYTSAVAEHANLVESTYGVAFSAGAWPRADWNQVYAAMLRYVADNGVAAAPDNAEFYGSRLSAGDMATRYLLNAVFYRAIAGRDWCYLEDLLVRQAYQDYTFWGTVAVLPQDVYGSEYFNLGVSLEPLPATTASSQVASLHSYFQTELSRRGLLLSPTNFTALATNLTWAIYNSNYWTNWAKAWRFRESLLADPRPQYDYSGCDAVVTVTIPNTVSLALTNRGRGWTSWLVGSGGQAATSRSVARLEELNSGGAFAVSTYAAAKPFGAVSGSSEPAYSLGIILPVYNEVRLIPKMLASSSGSSNPRWLNHRVYHLPPYTQQGLPGLDAGCFYCEQLRTLEDVTFRQEGIDWLTAVNPVTGARLHPCIQRGGGGGGGTGGVPSAH